MTNRCRSASVPGWAAPSGAVRSKPYRKLDPDPQRAEKDCCPVGLNLTNQYVLSQHDVCGDLGGNGQAHTRWGYEKLLKGRITVTVEGWLGLAQKKYLKKRPCFWAMGVFCAKWAFVPHCRSESTPSRSLHYPHNYPGMYRILFGVWVRDRFLQRHVCEHNVLRTVSTVSKGEQFLGFPGATHFGGPGMNLSLGTLSPEPQTMQTKFPKDKKHYRKEYGKI